MAVFDRQNSEENTDHWWLRQYLLASCAKAKFDHNLSGLVSIDVLPIDVLFLRTLDIISYGILFQIMLSIIHVWPYLSELNDFLKLIQRTWSSESRNICEDYSDKESRLSS